MREVTCFDLIRGAKFLNDKNDHHPLEPGLSVTALSAAAFSAAAFSAAAAAATAGSIAPSPPIALTILFLKRRWGDLKIILTKNDQHPFHRHTKELQNYEKGRVVVSIVYSFFFF